MREENFCKLFIFSILNLIGFLLTTIFLTSTYNAYELSEQYYSCEDTILSQYIGICALFSFYLISFLLYVVVLIILINKDKINSGNNNNNMIHMEDININNIEGENRGYNQNIADNQESIFSENPRLKIILEVSFLFCQLIYLLEVILLIVFFSKANRMYSRKICVIKEIKDIYRDLMIVALVFFLIKLVFYFYLLILYDKLGINARRRLEGITKSEYCECFSDCVEKTCLGLAKCFGSIDSETKIITKIREMKATNEEKINFIRELNIYKNQLENLNNQNLEIVDANEFTRLNLVQINRN